MPHFTNKGSPELADPALGVVRPGQARQASRPAHPIERGIKPQGEHDLGGDRGATAAAFHRADVGVPHFSDRPGLASRRSVSPPEQLTHVYRNGIRFGVSFLRAMKKGVHPGMVIIVTDDRMHRDRRSGADFVIMTSAWKARRSDSRGEARVIDASTGRRPGRNAEAASRARRLGRRSFPHRSQSL